MEKLYKVIAYIRVDAWPEDYEYYKSIEDAQSEVVHCESMQPENIYRVEEVTPEDEDWPENPEIISYPNSGIQVKAKDITESID